MNPTISDNVTINDDVSFRDIVRKRGLITYGKETMMNLKLNNDELNKVNFNIYCSLRF